MTPATKRIITRIITQAGSLALEAEGWTEADADAFQIDPTQNLRSGFGTTGTVSRDGEPARVVSAEFVGDDRGRQTRIQLTLQRPDHSHVRISRAVTVVITTAVID